MLVVCWSTKTDLRSRALIQQAGKQTIRGKCWKPHPSRSVVRKQTKTWYRYRGASKQWWEALEILPLSWLLKPYFLQKHPHKVFYVVLPITMILLSRLPIFDPPPIGGTLMPIEFRLTLAPKSGSGGIQRAVTSARGWDLKSGGQNISGFIVISEYLLGFGWLYMYMFVAGNGYYTMVQAGFWGFGGFLKLDKSILKSELVPKILSEWVFIASNIY